LISAGAKGVEPTKAISAHARNSRKAGTDDVSIATITTCAIQFWRLYKRRSEAGRGAGISRGARGSLRGNEGMIYACWIASVAIVVFSIYAFVKWGVDAIAFVADKFFNLVERFGKTVVNGVLVLVAGTMALGCMTGLVLIVHDAICKYFK
jgi:hypothetical protein